MAEGNRKKLAAFVEGKWRNGCPMCGESNWATSDDLFILPITSGGEMIIGGAGVYVSPVQCDTCGNMVFVNALVAGLEM